MYTYVQNNVYLLLEVFSSLRSFYDIVVLFGVRRSAVSVSYQTQQQYLQNHYSMKIAATRNPKRTFYLEKDHGILVISLLRVHEHVDGPGLKSTMTSTWTTFHCVYGNLPSPKPLPAFQRSRYFL